MPQYIVLAREMVDVEYLIEAENPEEAQTNYMKGTVVSENFHDTDRVISVDEEKE